MKPAPEIDVAYVANLARLDLTGNETALFREQLGDVLKYMAKLNEVNVEGVDQAESLQPNELRPDEAHDWLTSDEALGNAPRQRDHLFIVPKVVE